LQEILRRICHKRFSQPTRHKPFGGNRTWAGFVWVRTQQEGSKDYYGIFYQCHPRHGRREYFGRWPRAKSITTSPNRRAIKRVHAISQLCCAAPVRSIPNRVLGFGRSKVAAYAAGS